MELVNANKPCLLTNIEVLQLLNEKLQSKKKVRSQQTLLYTASKYLNTKSPCGKQSPDNVPAFAKAVEKYKLSKAEVLMLINHCPSSQVELSVVVADLDSRLSSTQADELLHIIETYFPEGVLASQSINSSGSLQESEETT